MEIESESFKSESDLTTTQAPADLSVTTNNGPTQPMLRSFPSRVFGASKRSFIVSYYTKYSFIEYSQERDAVFCFVCRHFRSCSNNAEDTFITKGYRDWKHLPERLANHAGTSCHKDCYQQWLGWNQAHNDKGVNNLLGKQIEEQVQSNRAAISSLARIALLCARQDIALRGHREKDATTSSVLASGTDTMGTESSKKNNNKGNFIEILELVKLESQFVRQNINRLPGNAKYTCKESQNDLLKSAAAIVTQKIVSEITSAGFFSVMADEARDNSHSEQMSICVRYFHAGIVKERFLCFVHVHDLSAAGLSSAIVAALQTNGINIDQCVGQCYDGASVMAGCYNGVQVKIQELIGHACIYVHCHAHKVNLILVDTCHSISAASDMFGLLEAVHTFLTVSTLRHDIFVRMQRDGDLTVLELPKQSDTRWTAKHRGVRTFVERFKEVCATLEKLSTDGKPKERAEARGLLLQLKSAETMFLLQVFDQCLGLTNALSQFLQGKQLYLGSALSLVTSTLNTLKSMRDDNHFQLLWQGTHDKMTAYDVTVTQERAKSARSSKPSKSLAESVILTTLGQRSTDQSNVHNKPDYYTKFRVLYFEIIDKMTGELERRFEKNDVFQAVDTLQPSSATFLLFEEMKPLLDMYSHLLFDQKMFAAEVVIAKEMILKQELRLSEDVIKRIVEMETAFPNLSLFCKLVMSFPVASASAERSFSTMKRVKTYLRSSTSDDRLSHLCILSSERELSGQLMTNPNDVIDHFARMKSRRMQFL